MERDFCCPPRKQDIVRRTGREARWGSANDPALGSSHFETGSDGDGLFRPRSPGSGREHLHLRPAVRELSAAIEPDDVSSGYGGYCSVTTQLAAHSYGDAPLPQRDFENHECHDDQGFHRGFSIGGIVATIIPENLGDYEPTAEFGNPPRLGQDIINEAQQNLAVTQGVASFFIHPDDDPLSVLEQVVTRLKALGYTFVSPATLMSTNG